ncbi:MAG: FlgB family protein [Paracoccaceae bacterium]
MFESLEITKMARAFAAHAGARLGVIAENVANADTPGFKSRDLPDFAQVWQQESGTQMRATRPGHLGAALAGPVNAAPVASAGGQASPNGNTVSLQLEMLRAAEVRQDHEMALAITRNASSLTRAALGLR